MKWEKAFEQIGEVYNARDGFDALIEKSKVKDFIKTEIIEKLIGEIPSKIEEMSSAELTENTEGQAAEAMKKLKEQLRDKWL